MKLQREICGTNVSWPQCDPNYLHFKIQDHVAKKDSKSLMGGVQWLTPIILGLWEAKAGRLLEVMRSRPVWPTWRNAVSTKNTKISWAWWCVPIIPAPQEAEA